MRGRPESPLDPNDGPVPQLAFELRKLREEAGRPSYREMARIAGFGVSTLSQAAAGERLATLPVVLAYVKACGGNTESWEQRWHQTAEEEAAWRQPEANAEPPYRGLQRFEPGDKDLFFGRDQITARLAVHVCDHRLVAVVGASGSGKSSLLRAGLIPALQNHREPGWRVAALRILTPGPHPLSDHAPKLEPDRGDGDTLVIVDQFEELFTLCTDPAERAAFLSLLLAAVHTESRLRVVIVVRADFFGRCAEHHALAEAVQEATLVVGPLGPAELREAIIRPAAAAGLIVERSLTAKIIREVTGEPGGLPLMSHVLLETWRRRRGRALTEAMYDAAGGIHGAIAKSAEQAYSQFTRAEAKTARRILLRLITPGDGVPDTRRPASQAELDADSPETGYVLERLIRARLLTLDGDRAELAHEALITAWPRYRAWIDENRERMRLHRRLTEAACTWDDLDRDSGVLYRGTRLAAVLDAFSPEDSSDLTSLESVFLSDSVAARDHEEWTTARATRRLRTLTTTLTILLVLALISGGIAWRQTHISEQQGRRLLSAQRVAVSRQLAAQSATLINSDPDLASLLAVEAYRSSPTKEAAGSLYAAEPGQLKKRLPLMFGALSMAFSPNGQTLAVHGFAGLQLLRIKGGARSAAFPDMNMDDSPMAFSPDGRILAVKEQSGRVRLRDMKTGKFRSGASTIRNSGATLVAFDADGRLLIVDHPRGRLRIQDGISGRLKEVIPDKADLPLLINPKAHMLVTTTRDQVLKVWDTVTGHPRIVLQKPDTPPESGNFPCAALSSDGRLLAVGGVGGSGRAVYLWDTATGRLRTTLNGHTGMVFSLAFSADGRTLASGGADSTVRLWDAASGQPRDVLRGHTSVVQSLAFGPDGYTLASGGTDGTVRLWNLVSDPAPRKTHLASPSVAFAPDGHSLIVGGEKGTVSMWSADGLSVTPIEPQSRYVGALASSVGPWKTTTLQLTPRFSAGNSQGVIAFGPRGRVLAFGNHGQETRMWDAVSGRTLATTSVGANVVLPLPDGHTVAIVTSQVVLWDPATGHISIAIDAPGGAGSIAVSASGRMLAISNGNNVTLYDMARKRAITLTRKDISQLVPEGVAFSPDGHTLAIAGPQALVLWDAVNRRVRSLIRAQASTMVFSPDGHTLAVAADGKAQLWDVTTGLLRKALPTGASPLTSLAFSPDGHTLIAANLGGKMWQWKVDVNLGNDDLIDRICQAVARNLTAQEQSAYLPELTLPPACPA